MWNGLMVKKINEKLFLNLDILRKDDDMSFFVIVQLIQTNPGVEI